jgi:Retroviral aspartyl protease
VTFRALLDPGSDISILNSKHYIGKNIKTAETFTVDKRVRMKLKKLNKTVEITVGKSKIFNNKYLFDHFEIDVLLGADWCQRTNVTINWKNQRKCFENEESKVAAVIEYVNNVERDKEYIVSKQQLFTEKKNLSKHHK